MKIEGMSLDGYALILQDGKKEVERTCPGCGERKPMSKFGLRLIHHNRTKEVRNQLRCTQCRSKA
jgi:hypothetical protein